ncbi:MAG: hypothetical protein P4M11_08715 [Candidatus Pacebacteria bacterium]|nr:hypothetical protein [Candidatus Paceibacterota bacterium]
MHSAAVKMIRDIKLTHSVLSDMMKTDDKRTYYLFNYVPRLVGKALRLTAINFEQKRINRTGMACMQETAKYLSDKLGPMQTLANRKILADYTFANIGEGANDLDKVMLFYEILLMEEGEMVEKLKKSKNYFTAEEVTLMMNITTPLRKPIPEDRQNDYKKSIFASR